MSKFTVVVDPSLKEIIPRYMGICLKDLVRLEMAIDSGDDESVRLLGHKLKGTGTSYGFAKLTSLGADIELSGQSGDIATAKFLAAEVRSYLENVEVIYGK